MKNNNNNTKLANRMSIGVLILTPTIFGLGYLLQDTEFKFVAPLLLVVVWLIYIFLTGKYFARMIKELFK